jgi:putative SOS response-associated peptidase YedK
MCGRYVLTSPPGDLAGHFDAMEAPGLLESYEASYNVAPTMPVLGLAVTRGGERILDTYRWGLIPMWVKDPSIGNRLINARAETLSTSRMFSDAFLNRRIAVLADGFYEWRTVPGRRRQPLFLHRADGQPLAFAGLRERWRDPEIDGEDGWRRTCTIVTTVANEDLTGIHDRMPVILEMANLDPWLRPTVPGSKADMSDIERLLRPAPPGTLVYHPVDPGVGDVRNDGPHLTAPYDADAANEAQPEPLRLFP